jgi:CRISPR/Cas system CMR subunit Cmr6 (Cas7 group RAMP superfamily)
MVMNQEATNEKTKVALLDQDNNMHNVDEITQKMIIDASRRFDFINECKNYLNRHTRAIASRIDHDADIFVNNQLRLRVRTTQSVYINNMSRLEVVLNERFANTIDMLCFIQNDNRSARLPDYYQQTGSQVGEQ